jgi:hypothetical protein
MGKPVAPDRAGRAVLHIGLLKSGTSFIQHQIRHHYEALVEDGVLFPGGRSWRTQVTAVRDLIGTSHLGRSAEQKTRTWKWLAGQSESWSGEAVLVSMEFLSFADQEQVQRAARSLRPRQVDVVVTVRDLARVVPAMWQESIQNRADWSWRAYADSLRDRPGADPEPARSFWRQHDLPRILRTWVDVVGADHVTLVTVPQRGADPDLLWIRFCQAAGLDTTRYPIDPRTVNTSLGVAGTELMRRLSLASQNRLQRAVYLRHLKHFLAKDVLAKLDDDTFGLGADDQEWAGERARQMVDDVRALGVPVIGDLAELVPPPSAARRAPDQVDDSAVLGVAVEAILAFVERLADRSADLVPDRSADAVSGPPADSE